MNRIFYLLIAGAVFFCSSCEKFLDKAALDKITNDNYYQDASQLNAAVNGIYNRVLISGYGQNGPAGQAQTLNGHFTYSDEAIQLNAALNVNNYASYIFDNSNVAVENLWQGMYQAIYHANSLIANVDKNPAIDASARSYALGQALFLRGYAFYVLASHFGGVPLR
ncbi:RagB/SusD family nutrient uptake outer membrane protein [Niabella hibiscisoli]|uniref:RagB/SusD family nutrient uptake outer membrane protein n=1 Tax=Niabella hibiscisoli TaxID=1825928 RepID=UPI001F0E277D|nr:RagB/SusD family nutrient uptake outer membrane protein [Niabella hibiscisoli]MCH5718381.1 RagB/SusD family nutrient uptake outer membrane protein [Niabella hibiscisoli]